MRRDRVGLAACCIMVAMVALLSVGCGVERGTSTDPPVAAVTAPTAEQQIAIYAPVISDALSRSQMQSRLRAGRRLYIVDSTGEAFGDPLFDRHQPPQRETLPAEVRAGLEGALHLTGVEIIWVKSFDEATDETSGLVSEGVAIAVGPIDLVSRNRARVPVTLYLGSLAANGWTSVVEMVGGAWAVTGTTGTGWTS